MPASFCLFLSFLIDTNQIIIDKSIDGVLGTRNWGSRMEGVDGSTELWRHLRLNFVYDISSIVR